MVAGPRRDSNLDAGFGKRVPGLPPGSAAACGWPAFAQYRPNPEGGHKAWAFIVLELSSDRIVGVNSFLDTEALFFPGSVCR